MFLSDLDMVTCSGSLLLVLVFCQNILEMIICSLGTKKKVNKKTALQNAYCVL